MTQNNLGGVLWDQAARIEGAEGNELLSQAVAAFRNALEVFTREQLPQGLGRNPAQPRCRAPGPGSSALV